MFVAADFVSQSSAGIEENKNSGGNARPESPLDRPGSPPWWLMTPGCKNGREEDAEAEFIEDQNQLLMESDIQAACSLDTKAFGLLAKVGEPLRSIVMGNLERTSSYLRYRNQVGKKMDNLGRRNSSSLINAGQLIVPKTGGPTPLSGLSEETDAKTPKTPRSPRTKRDMYVSNTSGAMQAISESGVSKSRGRVGTNDTFSDEDWEGSESKENDAEMDTFIRESIVAVDEDEDEAPVMKHSAMRKMSRPQRNTLQAGQYSSQASHASHGGRSARSEWSDTADSGRGDKAQKTKRRPSKGRAGKLEKKMSTIDVGNQRYRSQS